MHTSRATIQRPLDPTGGLPIKAQTNRVVAKYSGSKSLPPESESPSLLALDQHLGLPAIQIPAAADTSYLSHGYIRYIGKYPPQLVSYVLNKHAVDGLVVDPMCGGGTTLAESHVRGLDAIGFDVNPVARFAASVVSKPMPPAELETQANVWLRQLASEGLLGEKKPVGRPTSPVDWNLAAGYFSDRAKGEINAFLTKLEGVPEHVRPVFLTALFNVLRRVSFANIKKMNLEMDEKRTNPPALAEVYPGQLTDMVRRNKQFAEFGTAASVTIKEGDAASTGLPDSSAAAVFLHPPYMTNTAFSEFSQLQLAILGIPHKEIWKRELRCRGSFLHEPNGVRKYLIGWANIIKEAARIAEPGGTITAVVGDGQIDYVRIPVGTITKEFASDAGLMLEERFFNVYANHTGQTQSRKMVGQHVLIFRRPL